MPKISIKPLSVNDAWQGKRYKTTKYLVYESAFLFMLPDIKIPDGKLHIDIIVGYSNRSSDIDNFLKPFLDILQKKYGFNDRDVYKLTVVKEIVKKWDEFIDFSVSSYNP